MSLRQLSIRPVDVLGTVVMARVSLRVDGVESPPHPHEHSFDIPDGARVAEVRLESDSHWPVQQMLDLGGARLVSARGGRLYRPTVDISRPVVLTGSDHGVTVTIVLSALRNLYEDPAALATLGVQQTPDHLARYTWPQFVATPRPRTEVANGRRHIVRPPAQRFDFRAPRLALELIDHPVLGSGFPSPGWPRLNMRRPEVTPSGRVYFLQRRSRRPPHLIAVYTGRVDPATRAVGGGFHVFLHPFIKAQFPDPANDPYAYEYLARVRHYLFNYRLLYRTWASARRCVLVFPLGMKGQQFGNLLSHSAMRHLLDDVNFFIHSAGGATWEGYQTAPVSRVAVSGYSFGVNWLRALLANPGPGPRQYSRGFYNQLLKEVYWFDGMPDHFPAHLGELLSWYRRGRDDRRIRVYTSNTFTGATAASWNRFRQVLPVTPVSRHFENPDVRGRSGTCSEIESVSPHGTLVTLPPFFWDRIAPDPPRILPLRDAARPARGRQSVGEWYFWQGHGRFPALMLHHALVTSGFPSA